MGRSSKKSDEFKEVGGVMCKMISPHEARELPAPQCYLLASPHLYTSNNHASALLFVFLSSYIMLGPSTSLELLKVFFFVKEGNMHTHPVLFSGSV